MTVGVGERGGGVSFWMVQEDMGGKKCQLKVCRGRERKEGGVGGDGKGGAERGGGGGGSRKGGEGKEEQKGGREWVGSEQKEGGVDEVCSGLRVKGWREKVEWEKVLSIQIYCL